MRSSTLCLGVAALITLSLTVVSVQAQEISAQEEWLENVKLAQNLEARNLRNRSGKKVRGGSRALVAGTKKLVRRSTQIHDDLEEEDTLSTPIVLEKRRKGFPHRSELELRANYFTSFQADKLVEAPVSLRIVKEVTKKPLEDEILRFERESKKKSISKKGGKKAAAAKKETDKKAPKKTANKKLEKRVSKKASGKKASGKKASGKKASGKKVSKQIKKSKNQ
ncbi:hypothetical protein EMPS_04224 [Entomortierella parvispora]|uniref:Uncharacterized protein n=1 Tax=Entomortierella parvispora TaxID=205924 RepID=A0A9P3H8V2_9FUNG|nr:hypothetical protein EMPS_04224 [Entomortierella parvispora]